MNENDRNRIRAKQDRIIELAAAKGLAFDLRIATRYAGSPTLQELRHTLWPKFEPALDSALAYLASLTA